MSCALSSALAPGTTTMALSLFATTISAEPVALPSVSRTYFRSTPCAAEKRFHLRAEIIAANPADQRDLRAQPRRGDSLIGALAAWEKEHVAAEHRFADFRMVRRACDHVHVDAARNKNPAHATLLPSRPAPRMPACRAVRKAALNGLAQARDYPDRRLSDKGRHMSDRQAQTADGGRNFAIAVILACYLIGTFLWNVFVPAHEFQVRTAQMLTIGLNLLVGLYGLRASMPKPLFSVALVAGIGLLGLRLISDHGWWTGHLFYSLPPR